MALVLIATSNWTWAGSATPESIMVIPARQRMVQLAFEIASCKEIGLVTYNNSPTLPAPLLHAWNGQEWIQISMDDYVEGRFMSGDPKHVFLLGDSTTLPLKMMDGPTWYKDLNRITTMDIATIVNQMGNVLHFSARQWKWLAELYGMKIEDQSTERRRYGRWGAPGKEVDLSPNKLGNVVLPPAAPVADPIMPQQKPEVPVKVEAPKVEAPVVEKPAVPINVTTEPAKVEPAKVEPVKVEAPKVETPAKPEPPKVDPPAPAAAPAVATPAAK